MEVNKMRGWLLCQPRPHSLKVLGADGEFRIIECGGGQQWIHIAETVTSLQAETIEALDQSGKLLRAIRPAELSDDEEEDGEDGGIDVLANDPESARLITFAKLIADAYKHSTDVAFAKLGDLFSTMMTRTEVQGKTIEAQQAMMAELRVQLAEAMGQQVADAGGMPDLMQAFVSGMAQKALSAAPTQPPPVANGQPKGK